MQREEPQKTGPDAGKARPGKTSGVSQPQARQDNARGAIGASGAKSDEPRQRRALTHVGGTIETAGDAADAKQLAHALDVVPSSESEAGRVHVHGFHTYPARMHPDTAARLVSAFVPTQGRILDPFCGSGTVLVEALIQGRRPIGTDLNPLAVRLSRCKARPRTAADLEHIRARANECAAHADERRKAKAGATRRFLPEDVALFEPHVLLELDSLRAKIETFRDDPARFDLQLVLTAILVKLSGRRGDTSEAVAPRHTAAGFAARLFVQKTDDLAMRLAEMSSLLSSPTLRPAVIEQDDATVLRSVQPRPVDAIITSPPYAATYDYVMHHALRLRWLGLNPSPLIRGEFGARSTYQKIAPSESREVWSRELAKFFQTAAGVLAKGSPLVLVMGDSAVGDVALRADEIVADTARVCGFIASARASQDRPHFHGPTMAAFRTRPRAEHAILLRRK